MKVWSPHAYRLPGLVSLPKGESELADLPAPAKKFLDGLISDGIVRVVGEPAAAPPSAPAMAPAPSWSPPASAASASGDGADDGKKRSKKKE